MPNGATSAAAGPGWRHIGVWSAAVAGFCFLASMLLLLFVVSAAGRAPPITSPAAFAHHEATWPWAPLALGLLAIGFLALAPLGLALRARYGRGRARWDLIALLLGGTAVMEATVLLLQAASRVALMELGRGSPTEIVTNLLVLIEVAGFFGIIFAMFTFLMVAAGCGLAAADVLTGNVTELPRGWAWLSAAVALVLIMGQLGIVTGQFGLVMGGRALGLGVLIPIWAFWLGHRMRSPWPVHDVPKAP